MTIDLLLALLLLAILDDWMRTITRNHKLAAMALLFKIETCNEIQTPLILGESSISTRS